MALIDIGDLRGGYGEVDILNGIDLTVGEREIVMVAGPNGCGKSTLAKALLGLLPRVNGRIALGGRDLLRLPAEERVRLGIAYVPQVANVFPSLTVLENLQVVELDGVNLRQSIAEMFATFPALAERRRNSASSLSGGERQQLAFARALIGKPKIMVLDEPTANVSAKLVAEIFQRIRSMPAMGSAVLLIEQRAREGLAIADRGYVLNGGRVVSTGPAKDLLADEKLAEQFLGHAVE